MFSMPILDVAIGLSFFYLLLGLICSTLNEMIASWLGTRAKFLDQGIERLLSGDTQLKALVYQHPLIKSLAASASQIAPSYIPAEKFATALLDVVSGKGKSLMDVDAIKAGAKTTNDDFQTSLQALIDSSPDAATLHKKVADWFNDNMDRVSGWYKRNAQRNALLLACGVTLVLNADTIHVANILWTNPTMRAAVVQSAQSRVQKGEPLPMVDYTDPNSATASTPINVPKSPEEGLSDTEKSLLGQLTGWAPDWASLSAASNVFLAALMIIYNHGIGWILTAIAVSLGAPFWFDTLNRFMNIRNAGRAPDEPRDKTSPPPATT